MRKSNIPSPARSLGAPKTPRSVSRGTRSVGSPARSTASVRLSSVIGSFALSPLDQTHLTDNTDIVEPKRKSWWKKVENSRDVIEVMDGNKPVEIKNVLEELDVEILSQGKKDYTMDLPESSGSESITSIVVPQRKLFSQKENQHMEMFDKVRMTRKSAAKENTTIAEINAKIADVGPKDIFNKGPKRPKCVFPAALLNISPDKTIANKSKEIATEVTVQPRSLFGNRQGTKRKNIFADLKLVASESESDISDIQPKLFAFQKNQQPVRHSTGPRNTRETSPATSVTTDIEMDDWKLLPSSTMVEYQLEALSTPDKRARLSKLSVVNEAESGTNATLNKTKQSNKSSLSKNKSKTYTIDTNNELEVDKAELPITSGSHEEQTDMVAIKQCQLEYFATPDKRERLSKLSEVKEAESGTNTTMNKTKQSNKFSLSKNKSKTYTIDTNNEFEVDTAALPIISGNHEEQNDNRAAIKQNATLNKSKGNSSKTNNISRYFAIKQNATLNKSKGNSSKTNNISRYFADEVGAVLNHENVEMSNVNNSTKKIDKTSNQNNSKSNNINDDNNAGEYQTQFRLHDQTNKHRESFTAVAESTSDKSDQQNDDDENITLTYDENEPEEHNQQYNDYINQIDSHQIKNDTTKSMNTIEVDIRTSESKKNGELQKKLPFEKSNDGKHSIIADFKQSVTLQHETSQEINVGVKKPIQNSHDVSREMEDNQQDKSQVDGVENDEHEKIESDENHEAAIAGDEEIESDHQMEHSEIINDKEDEQINDDEEENDDGDEIDHDKSEVQNESQQVQDDVEHTMQNESEVEQNEKGDDVENESQENDGNEGLQNRSQENESNGKVQNESQEELQNDEEGNIVNESQKNKSNDEAQNESQENESNDEVEEEFQDEEEDNVVNESQENGDSDEVQNESQENESSHEVQNESQEELQGEEEDNIVNESQENWGSDEIQNESQENESIEEVQNESEEELQNEEEEKIENQSQEIQDNDDEEEQDKVVEDSQQNLENETETNVTHDTTGRNRKKETVRSPEVILHDMTNQYNSFTARGRNTGIRKTKSILKNFTIRPSMAPPRQSTGISDGTKNSSAEGSGWDSHRTTRKTMRQTFGKDFTPRKSLRTLVMERSAKRQTAINAANADLEMPQANSTELPETTNQDYEMEYEDNVEVPDPVPEISMRTRQTTMEMYMQKITKENIERKNMIDEYVKEVKNSVKCNSARMDILNRIAYMPAVRQLNSKADRKPAKAKQVKPSPISFEDLPPELVEDMKYRPPKRYRPSNASWITKRLYKFLEKKLEPKYDYKARTRAEKLVESIYSFARDIRKHRVAPPHAVCELKQEMARLNIVRTHFDFYHFFSDYMPLEVKIKVVPDVVNDIPMPRKGLYSDILDSLEPQEP